MKSQYVCKHNLAGGCDAGCEECINELADDHYQQRPTASNPVLKSDIVIHVAVDSGCIEIGFGAPYAEVADIPFMERAYRASIGHPFLRDGNALLLKTRHGDGRHRLVLRQTTITKQEYCSTFKLGFDDKEQIGMVFDVPAGDWFVGDCGNVHGGVDHFPGCNQMLIYRGNKSLYLHAITLQD